MVSASKKCVKHFTKNTIIPFSFPINCNPLNFPIVYGKIRLLWGTVFLYSIISGYIFYFACHRPSSWMTNLTSIHLGYFGFKIA